MSGFADRLKVARGTKGVVEVAEAAGVDRTTLWRLEHDGPKGGPDLATVERLAQACGVSPGWLAFGEGE